jgi:hypothetical protein
MASEEAALDAMAAGFARGLELHLRAERPDLSWEVTVGPVDRAKLARLEADDDEREES